MILFRSENVERNPGPNSIMTTTSDNGCDSDIALSLFCQYQSLLPKIELVECELSKFDCTALTETWSNQSIPNNDICIQWFKPPYRYDRPHSGVAVYVNETLYSKRQSDRGVECIWIEMSIKHNPVLIGTKSLDLLNLSLLRFFILYHVLFHLFLL